MALNRIIKISITAITLDGNGEEVRTVESNKDYWSELLQSELSRELTESGSIQQSDSVYRIRFDKLIIEGYHAGKIIQVKTRYDPDYHTVTAISESGMRDQWLDLQI